MFLIKGLHPAMGISKGTTTDFMALKVMCSVTQWGEGKGK